MTFTKTSPKGYKYTNKDITIYINYVWGYRNKEFNVTVLKGFDIILNSNGVTLSTLKGSKKWLKENYK